MPELTRRGSPDAPDECWHVFYGDVRVGTIALRTGMPPGKVLGAGHAASIPAAIPANARTAPRPRSPRPAPTSRQRGGYFCQNRTEADFQAWRDQRDWTAEKYRRFDRGERMPPDLRQLPKAEYKAARSGRQQWKP
jgi:hypothetical protein